jgi:hypothetical protein
MNSAAAIQRSKLSAQNRVRLNKKQQIKKTKAKPQSGTIP